MQVLALDSVFDHNARRGLVAPPRSSISDIVELAYPGTPMALRRDIVMATINGVEVPVEAWERVRPKVGTVVILKPVPQGDVLRNVLTIAVVISAIALGQIYAPTLAGALGFSGTVATKIAGAVITASVLGVGNYLINALVPARVDEKQKPTYAIQGMRNQFTPNGVVPLILGFVRYAPPYAASPYTQSIGDQQYIIAAFCNGYGPLGIYNWRIGETSIERYMNVKLNTRQGYAADPRLEIYTKQVIQENLQIELKSMPPTGGPQIRVTAADCVSCEIDVAFASGVYGKNKDGEDVSTTVAINIRYRLAGTTAWTAGPGIIVVSAKQKPLTRTVPITFATRGRYEIELTRLTEDYDDLDQSKKKVQRSGRSTWTAIRSYRPEYPINFDKPLSLTECHIRATGQLQGTLDALNAEFRTICPDWNAASGTWIERETNNPASLFRYVLAGPAIAYPYTSDEIEALGEWHAFCVAKKLTYNRAHDYEASVYDVLADVAAAGRAKPHDNGTAWGVVIDRAMDWIAAHICPRNSWGFSGERPYIEIPHAFRVRFLDETNDFKSAERIVPWPDFTGVPTVIEGLDLPGVTNPDMVWREARRRQHEILRRPDTYTVNQDFQSIGYVMGDRVELSHDVLERTQVSARVVSVNGPQVVLDEFVTFEEGVDYSCRFRMHDGTSVVRTARGTGTTCCFVLEGAGPSPVGPTEDFRSGELAFFGPTVSTSFACTVQGIESMENLNARVTLKDHASEIEALIDAEVPPPWSGRAGDEAQEPVGAPQVPVVVDVVSGQSALEAATTDNPYPILVFVQAAAGETMPIASFTARHRKVGTTTWKTESAPASAGVVLLDDYVPADRGANIEFQAAAVASNGTPSAWGATIVHTIAAADPGPPINLRVAVERRIVSGTTTADRLRLTCNPTADTALVLGGRYRAIGATAWLDMVRDGDSLYSLVSPDIVFGQAYEAEGSTATPAGSRRSDWIDATPAVISAPIYTADLQFAAYVGAGAPTVARASSGYAANSGGAFALFAADTLRRTNAGLTIEEAQTNHIRNNSMQGTMAGTPGMLPMNWAIFNEGNGVTRQIVGTGTENNIDYIDLRYSGTVTAGTIIAIDVEPAVAAAAGQLWTYSNFVKLVGGTLNGVTIARHIAERGGSTTPNTQVSFVPTGASLGSQRGAVSRTLTVANSTGIIGRLYIITTTGANIDLTLRIGWPQLERRDNLGIAVGQASSPIRTTGSAVTRAADAVTLPLVGVSRAVLTFSDGTTQEITGIATAAPWQIPAASLTRSIVTKLAAYAS